MRTKKNRTPFFGLGKRLIQIKGINRLVIAIQSRLTSMITKCLGQNLLIFFYLISICHPTSLKQMFINPAHETEHNQKVVIITNVDDPFKMAGVCLPSMLSQLTCCEGSNSSYQNDKLIIFLMPTSSPAFLFLTFSILHAFFGLFFTVQQEGTIFSACCPNLTITGYDQDTNWFLLSA